MFWWIVYVCILDGWYGWIDDVFDYGVLIMGIVYICSWFFWFSDLVDLVYERYWYRLIVKKLYFLVGDVVIWIYRGWFLEGCCE